MDFAEYKKKFAICNFALSYADWARSVLVRRSDLITRDVFRSVCEKRKSGNYVETMEEQPLSQDVIKCWIETMSPPQCPVNIVSPVKKHRIGDKINHV